MASRLDPQAAFRAGSTLVPLLALACAQCATSGANPTTDSVTSGSDAVTATSALPLPILSATSEGATAMPDSTGTTEPSSTLTSATSAADDRSVRVLLGGDVSFGRRIGQRVLSEPTFAPFAGIEPWLGASELRMVNLESVLTDQGGQTEHPLNPLVFCGPPQAALHLRDAGIDAVSVANNHAWDYGRKGLQQSLATLKAARILTVGASANRSEPYRHQTWTGPNGTIALLAFTQVWNDGALAAHAAAPFVADADFDRMRQAVRRAHREADFVIVSLHASNEYVDAPREGARAFARGLLLAGADLVFAHHPHVLQGIEWISGQPILYSLGNLLFDSRQQRQETRAGAIALVDLSRSAASQRLHIAQLRLCPVKLIDGLPVRDENTQAFGDVLVRLSEKLGGLVANDQDDLGCVPVRQASNPLPYAQRRGFNPAAHGQPKRLQP